MSELSVGACFTCFGKGRDAGSIIVSVCLGNHNVGSCLRHR